MSGVLRSSFHGGAPAQHNQVCERNLFAARLRTIELVLDLLQRLQDFGQLCRIVDFPILLRCQTNASSVGATSLVATAERGGRRPCRRNQLRDREPRSEDLFLKCGDVLLVNQFVIDVRNRVLPQLRLGNHAGRGNVRPDPCRGALTCTRLWQTRVLELFGILMESFRDRAIDRIHLQRQVGREHHRRMRLRRIVSVRYGALGRFVFGSPLIRPGWTLGQFPFVTEQIVEVAV